MIERTTIHTAHRTDVARDERSMRVMEYVMAFVALGAAILLAIR